MQSLIEQLQRENVLLFLACNAVAPDELAVACQELARLPFRRVVSLGEAPQLLAAWRRAGRAIEVVEVVSPDDPPPRLDESLLTWLTLPRARKSNPAWLAQLLRNWFAKHTVCLLGCDLEDPGFRERYLEIAHAIGPHRRACHAIVENCLAEADRHDWEAKNLHLTVAAPQDWVRQLIAAWARASEVAAQAQERDIQHAGSPYRFLDSFTEAEADCFFGRSTAMQDLYDLALAERLVLCFGPSGAGKTSLLQAGLVPRLRGQGCLPLYSRPGTDPVQEIRRAALAQECVLPLPLGHASRDPTATSAPPLVLPRTESPSLGPHSPRDQGQGGAQEGAGRLSEQVRSASPLDVAKGRGARRGTVVTLPHRNETETDVPLAELLSDLSQRTGETVVVLLDQFEEVFTLLGEETVSRLAAELAGCLRLPDGAVHVVLSLREDYLAHLHRLQPHLAQVYAYRFRLLPLNRDQAREAVEEPARLFGLRYEPELTAQLLEDLGRDDGTVVEPSDLQIVCEALYRDLQARGDDTFALARYRELGGAARILGDHLERVTAAGEAPDQARAVLKAMTTAQGTRALLPAAEIARLAGLDEASAVEILRSLDRPHRLVRPVQQEDGLRYELAHEVLGPRILAWIEEPAEREAKAAHDLLRAELHNWQRFGVLPGPGKLRAVHAQRDNPYLRLGRAEVELMVRGALRHDLEPADWLARAEATGVQSGDFLLPALVAPQAELRRQAVHLLGPDQALVALSPLLTDASPSVRARAAATVGEIDRPEAQRLLRRARHDAADLVRSAAWDALEAWAPRTVGRLRRQDEVVPLLLAGSLTFWLSWILAQRGQLIAVGWHSLAWAAGLWLAGLLTLGLLPLILPPRPLAWLGGGLAVSLLIALYGSLYFDVILLLLLFLGGCLWRRPHLAPAALLPFLPLLDVIDADAAHVLWTTGGLLLALSVLALVVPRWGSYGADRAAAFALLGAAMGATVGALLTGSDGAELAAAIALGTILAAGRWWAQRPLAYTGTSRTTIWAMIGRAMWDQLEQTSFKVKPFLGSLFGAVCAAFLMAAATGLSSGKAPTWNWVDALWLGAGLGLGLWWAQGGLLRAMLLPALGGAAGGALARGVAGALVGAGMGLGLGLGEWLAARLATAGEERSAAEG